MEFVLATIERRRLLVPVPFALMKLQAVVLQFLPKPPITPDQVELLKTRQRRVRRGKRDGRTLEGLGITRVDRRDRADLSVALPQDRPVQRASGVSRSGLVFERQRDAGAEGRDFPSSTFMSILVTSATRRSRSEPAPFHRKAAGILP